MNAAELDWTNISSTAFGRACLECVQWVWVRLERTWLGLDGLSWRRRGVVHGNHIQVQEQIFCLVEQKVR